MKFLANSKGQPLEDHLRAVARLSEQLSLRFFRNKNLSKVAYYAGLLHDVGKTDKGFQTALKGNNNINFNKPVHNELSLLVTQILLPKLDLREDLKSSLKYAVLYHHAKVLRKAQWESISQIKYSKDFLKRVDSLLPLLGLGTTQDSYYDKKAGIPPYRDYVKETSLKDYSIQVKSASQFNIVKSVLITADRIVSAISPEELTQRLKEDTLLELFSKVLETPLTSSIKTCLDTFEENFPGSPRNKAQREAVEELNTIEGVAVLRGPAGCGKTKIALEWAKEAKRIYWVCPRQTVCEGIFRDLQELLPSSRIELITGRSRKSALQGSVKEIALEDAYHGEVIITTIDQVSKGVITHRGISVFVDFLTSHVVFDEFHEFASIQSYNLLFPELIESKKELKENWNTLLVSATPNNVFVEELLGLRNNSVKIDTFNERPFKFTLGMEYEELLQDHKKGTIVITNTAKAAQEGKKAYMDDILFHSKFVLNKKETILNSIYKEFGTEICNSVVLRASSIIQSSVNITCSRMLTEVTTPENWCQRLGRVNRYGEDIVAEYVTAGIVEKSKESYSSGTFLSQISSYYASKEWLKFLQENLNPSMKLIEVYNLYEEFYATKEGRKSAEKDLVASLSKSVKVLKKALMPPLKLPAPKGNSKKLPKKSLRGDGRYIKVAKYSLKEGILNEYLEEPLTLSISEIEGYSPKTDQNLASTSLKVNKLLKKEKRTYSHLLDLAVDEAHAINVSFITDELEPYGLKHNPNSIYYNEELGLIRL